MVERHDVGAPFVNVLVRALEGVLARAERVAQLIEGLAVLRAVVGREHRRIHVRVVRVRLGRGTGRRCRRACGRRCGSRFPGYRSRGCHGGRRLFAVVFVTAAAARERDKCRKHDDHYSFFQFHKVLILLLCFVIVLPFNTLISLSSTDVEHCPGTICYDGLIFRATAS